MMSSYRGNHDFLEKEQEKLKEARRTEQQNQLKKNIFAFQLSDCPPSLKLIVQVYR